jgi:hypothetical protein
MFLPKKGTGDWQFLEVWDIPPPVAVAPARFTWPLHPGRNVHLIAQQERRHWRISRVCTGKMFVIIMSIIVTTIILLPFGNLTWQTENHHLHPFASSITWPVAIAMLNDQRVFVARLFFMTVMYDF